MPVFYEFLMNIIVCIILSGRYILYSGRNMEAPYLPVHSMVVFKNHLLINLMLTQS